MTSTGLSGKNQLFLSNLDISFEIASAYNLLCLDLLIFKIIFFFQSLFQLEVR